MKFMRLLEQVANSLRNTPGHDPSVHVAPAYFLCPDGDRQSEAVVPGSQHDLPERCPLGHFVAYKTIRPWIWIRWFVVSGIKNAAIPSRFTSVLFFTGICRHDLPAVENCPATRKPLAEPQFGGVIWSQVGTRDWTALAVLESGEGCLLLDMSRGIESIHAMQLALNRVSREDLELLRGTHLNKDYHNALLSGGQPVGNLLQRLDQCDPFRTSRGGKGSRGLLAVCRAQFWLAPGKDDPLKAAPLLAPCEGSAAGVWPSSRQFPATFLSAGNRCSSNPSARTRIPLQRASEHPPLRLRPRRQSQRCRHPARQTQNQMGERPRQRTKPPQRRLPLVLGLGRKKHRLPRRI